MIVIIDYGMGNLGSIRNMFHKIGADCEISSDISHIQKADKLILPGVGAFDVGIKNIIERDLVNILNKRVIQEKIPLLGICLGMQLLTKKSEEGDLPGLGWIDGETKKFRFDERNAGLKIPHMGWNHLLVNNENVLFKHLNDEIRFYFVHSYHVVCNDVTNDISAITFHGYRFVSALKKDNIFGVQFHPEKSHKFGMQLLKNFAEM